MVVEDTGEEEEEEEEDDDDDIEGGGGGETATAGGAEAEAGVFVDMTTSRLVKSTSPRSDRQLVHY
eukprot:SAG11_NODE_5098_length_1665_cov_1.454662_1_plen_66_part_00